MFSKLVLLFGVASLVQGACIAVCPFSSHYTDVSVTELAFNRSREPPSNRVKNTKWSRSPTVPDSYITRLPS